VVTATVVARDERFLFVEENIDGRVVLNQPAGHLDPGETLLECAVRETLEETGWVVAIESLIGIYLLATETPGKTFLRFCFAARPLRHDANRTLDEEIVRTHWLDRAALVERRSMHRSPLVLRAIDDYLAGQRYPLALIHDYLRG